MRRAKSIPPKAHPLRDARLTAVNFVADAVNRTLDLREIADNALHAILSVAKLDAGAMYRWQEDEQELALFAWRGLPESFTRQVMIIHRGEDPTIDAVLAGATRVAKDFAVARGVGQASARAGFGAAILCPIRAQQGIVGLLVLGRKRARPFTSPDVDLIEVIANQIGIATVKAQLLKDLGRKNELLELLIEEAHHRIKNNLQMISGLLQLEMTETREGPYTDRLRHAVSRIQAIAQVHNLLSQEMPDNVDTRLLITAITRALVASAPVPSGPPRVALNLGRFWLDADRAVALALIVNEVVANALLHGQPPAGQPLRIQVRSRRDNGTVVLVVTDNGGGIPEHIRTRADGGQGINIVGQLAQVNLRGTLEIRNHEGGVRAELTFTVARPAPPSARDAAAHGA